MRREKRFALLIIVGLISISTNTYGYVEEWQEIGNLILITNGGGEKAAYCSYIAQYLRDIGIEVEVRYKEPIEFPQSLLIDRDFDLGILEFNARYSAFGRNIFPRYVSPDMRDIYNEGAFLNFFGLDKEIPYYNTSEIMLNQGISITDLETRQLHYYEWQELVIDKIVPILPIFTADSNEAMWKNVLNFDIAWGICDSLPYMSFDGLHEGQTNISEFNIAGNNWKNLNPLLINDQTSYFISNLINEPIIQFGSNLIPSITGLVENWTFVDDYHYKFVLRDNIFWSPSYNITLRNASSEPLSLIPNEELMTGLKNGEFSNGTNQQLKAKDAVFTYLLFSHPDITANAFYHEWISDIYVDPADDLAFHIHIDGIPYTPEIEDYVDFWSYLPENILPEFYLNSSSSVESYTLGGVKCKGIYPEIVDTPQWKSYSSSAFGVGKFMLDYSIKNSKTVLTKNPNWFGVGAIDGSTGMTLFVDKINIFIIPDKSAQLSYFESGNLDWIDLTDVKPYQIKQFQLNSSYWVQSTPIPRMSFMFFNLDSPIIGGIKNLEYLTEEGKENYTRGTAIRKAICYAIDREEINQVIHEGEFQLVHSVILPYIEYYYYDNITKYKYDLDSSFEWLEAAGYGPTASNNNFKSALIVVTVFLVFLGLVPTVSLVSFIRKRKIRKS